MVTETLTVFLLTVLLQTKPVIIGVDGEYPTKEACAQARLEAVKDNPEFKTKIRCLQVVLDAPKVKQSPAVPKQNKNIKEIQWLTDAYISTKE